MEKAKHTKINIQREDGAPKKKIGKNGQKTPKK
jgi:hypothetical protein